MQKDPNLRYQSAGEMLKDLSKALKNPDGDFVGNTMKDYPTQVISTIYTKPMEEKIKEKDKKMKEEKKKNKVIAFLGNHKIASTIVGLIILFVLTELSASFSFVIALSII